MLADEFYSDNVKIIKLEYNVKTTDIEKLLNPDYTNGLWVWYCWLLKDGSPNYDEIGDSREEFLKHFELYRGKNGIQKR